jgi:hypothetical protein
MDGLFIHEDFLPSSATARRLYHCYASRMPILVKLGFGPLWSGMLIAVTVMIGVVIPPRDPRLIARWVMMPRST